MQCRVVPGQIDDVLVGWDDLNRLGMDCRSTRGVVVFDCGVSFPTVDRSSNVSAAAVATLSSPAFVRTRFVRLLDHLVVPAQSTVFVSATVDVDPDSSIENAKDMRWYCGSVELCAK